MFSASRRVTFAQIPLNVRSFSECSQKFRERVATRSRNVFIAVELKTY